MFLIKDNFVNNFLWSCAGVNKDILKLYPSEYAKYAGSGGTILFTAIMAVISGGYALFFVFNSVILAILFGLIWGLLIFNLDRFIVNSMSTDGKDTLSLKKIKAASPRIIMAIFLGIVISTPLEMKIFNDRIESLLLKDNIQRVNEVKKESKDYILITNLLKEQTFLSKERQKLADDLKTALKELKDEAEGTALSGIVGHGSIYRDKEIYVNQCKQSLELWDQLHSERLIKIQKRINEVNAHIEKFETKIDNVNEDGFSARYEAFANIREQNMSLNIVSIMITLMFIIIEVTPTLFKLIMTTGPYEEHIMMEKYKVHAFVQKERSNISTDLLISEYNNQKKLFDIVKPIKLETILSENKKQEIIYSAPKPEPEEVPYRVKSNTSITIKTKEKSKPTYPISKQGRLVLNFAAKHDKL